MPFTMHRNAKLNWIASQTFTCSQQYFPHTAQPIRTICRNMCTYSCSFIGNKRIFNLCVVSNHWKVYIVYEFHTLGGEREKKKKLQLLPCNISTSWSSYHMSYVCVSVYLVLVFQWDGVSDVNKQCYFSCGQWPWNIGDCSLTSASKHSIFT